MTKPENKIKLTNVKITNTGLDVAGASTILVNFPDGQFVKSDTATGASLNQGAWATVQGSSLIK